MPSDPIFLNLRSSQTATVKTAYFLLSIRLENKAEFSDRSLKWLGSTQEACQCHAEAVYDNGTWKCIFT